MSRRAVSGLAALGMLLAGLLVALAALEAGDTDRAAAARRGGNRGDLFAELADPRRIGSFGRGAWSWFQDPRAVHVGGTDGPTFVGWIAWNGAITVGDYDPVRGLVRTHVLGHWIHDDHASPAILVEPDGRLTVFWSGHNGHTMDFRTSQRPEDISAWGPVQHLHARLAGDLGFTYPNPVLLPAENDKLYLFWRGASWSTDYVTRTVSGRWSKPDQLIAVPGERPYVKVASNGSDEIAFAFTNAHPRNTITSIYYAVYRHGSLWTAGGRWIARIGKGPIAPSQADLVYNGPRARVPSWVWDVALAHDGDPVIVYATFPSVSDAVYWYAVWNDRRWVSHFLTFGGASISPGTIETEYSGGIALDHADPSILYLSKEVGRSFEIQRWITSDGGYRWQHGTVIDTGSDAIRPVVPRGAAGPIRLLWMSGDYGRYIRYRTSIAFLTGTA
jgi:BNR repeat-containing family member